jgi:opacity protein-like surface antigen
MRIFITALFLISCLSLFSQKPESSKTGKSDTTIYTKLTFKATRIVIGESVETPPNGAIVLLVSHHFGSINTKFYEFWGLDQASTRLGLEYGINDFLGVGIGRSTYNKTFDGYFKIRVLRQSKGKMNMPLSVTLFSDMAYNTVKLSDPKQEDVKDARLSYCTELMLARKFGDIFSIQVAPTWIHKNLVDTPADHNNLYSLGTGISFRVSKMISVNGEYHYLFPGQDLNGHINSVSIGCDIKVGEHVFQLFLTNSQPNFEEAFITESNGVVKDGYIYFGFNIHRYFMVKSTY